MQGLPRMLTFIVPMVLVALVLSACGVSPAQAPPDPTATQVLAPPPVMTQGLGPSPTPPAQGTPESTAAPEAPGATEPTPAPETTSEAMDSAGSLHDF
jgi:hypothetical protein